MDFVEVALIETTKTVRGVEIWRLILVCKHVEFRRKAKPRLTNPFNVTRRIGAPKRVRCATCRFYAEVVDVPAKVGTIPALIRTTRGELFRPASASGTWRITFSRVSAHGVILGPPETGIVREIRNHDMVFVELM